jgi:hypothetical protein
LTVYSRRTIEDHESVRYAILLAVLAVLAAAAALAGSASATNPVDARIVAGFMPGFPHALPARFGKQTLTPARRRLLVAKFARIRIGGIAPPAVTSMGRIHKVLHYTQAGNLCDYFDGGFVLCVVSGKIAAKGYEIAY